MAEPASQVETRAQCRANELLIVQYLLGEVAELSENLVKYLTEDQGFERVSTLKSMNLDDVKEMMKERDSPLKRAQKPTLLKLIAIIQDILATENPPTTVEQWKELATREDLEAYEDVLVPETESIVPSVIQSVITEDPDAGSRFRIKLSEYPAFDGRQPSWPAWKRDFEAYALAAQLPITNLIGTEKKRSDHQTRMASDPTYKDESQSLFTVLLRVCSKGTAHTWVKQYLDTRDGILAWTFLCDYYDNEGDKDTFSMNFLIAILELKLEYNSNGGFDTYSAKFDKLCTALKEAEAPLSDIQKRVFFKYGIKDGDYNTTKDINAKKRILRSCCRVTEKGN